MSKRSARFIKRLLASAYTTRASDISAFVTPDSFMQYSVMAFGMCNAPATFQCPVNIVPKDVPNCTTYLDDLVIHSATWSEHIDSLRADVNSVRLQSRILVR